MNFSENNGDLALEHQSNGQIISQHENPDESRMQKRVKSGREINQKNIERDNMFNSSSPKNQKGSKRLSFRHLPRWEYWI